MYFSHFWNIASLSTLHKTFHCNFIDSITMGKKERVPNAAHFYTGFRFHRNLMWPNKHKVASNISKVLEINKERSLPRRTILRNNPLYSPLVLEMVLYVHSPNYDICQCPACTMDTVTDLMVIVSMIMLPEPHTNPMSQFSSFTSIQPFSLESIFSTMLSWSSFRTMC